MEAYALPLILLDIAIFPVTPFFAMPITLFIVMLLFFKRIKKFSSSINPWIVLFVITIIISMALSLLLSPRSTVVDNAVSYYSINSFKENIKRGLYLLLGIVIYQVSLDLCCKYYVASRHFVNIVLMIICLFSLLIAFIFMWNKNVFIQIRQLFFSSNINTLNDLSLVYAGYFERFNFIFLDPNNAGYFLLMISIFLYENGSQKKKYVVFSVVTFILAPLLTKSSGVIITVCIYLALKTVKALKHKRISRSAVICFLILAIFVVVIVGCLMLFEFTFSFNVLNRFRSNSMSPRFNIYWQLITHAFPPVIGSGYTLILNEIAFSPHSDHLRFIYGYGIISYICLLFLFLRKSYFSSNYYFLLPVLVSFTINSLIDEIRFLYVFLILLAVVNATRIGSNKGGIEV